MDEILTPVTHLFTVNGVIESGAYNYYRGPTLQGGREGPNDLI